MTDTTRLDSVDRAAIHADETHDSPRVTVNAEMSRVAAVHARGLLDKVILEHEKREGPLGALWATWPLRTVAVALTDAIGDGE